MTIIDSQNYHEADLQALQPVIWSESFSVGEENIDDDHRCLIAQLNAIYLAIREGFDEDTIRGLMGQLADDELDHLNYEIAVLRRHDYPLVAEHEAAHNTIIVELSALKNHAKEYSLAELIRIAMAAKAAMLRHLISEDGRYKSYLQLCAGT